MEFQDLKQLSELPEEELTGKIIKLFGIIQEYHDRRKGLAPFSWQDLETNPDGTLYLKNLTETDLTRDVCLRNYTDFAGIIYCICAKEMSPKSMSRDADRKIKQPVLREIVLTFCWRNIIINLIPKLRQPYVDKDTFFSDYTSVDQKEAAEKEEAAKKKEAAQKEAKSRKANKWNFHLFDREKNYEYGHTTLTPWYRNCGTAILIMLCIGGYRACRSHNSNHLHQSYPIQRISRTLDQKIHSISIPPVKLGMLHKDTPFTVIK